jgi:hypothetical protein
MNKSLRNSVNVENVNPLIVKRKCGGWLAVSPALAELRIGAVGNTEEEARSNFSRLVRQWSLARKDELAAQQASH